MAKAPIRVILVATLLLTSCTGSQDYGARLRRECASAWREIKDSSHIHKTNEESWTVACIMARAMRP